MRWAIIAAVAVVALAGCNEYNDARGKGDAPALPGDDSPASITNMPDGFGNVATKCLNGASGLRVTVTTSTGSAPSFMVVTADPGCSR